MSENFNIHGLSNNSRDDFVLYDGAISVPITSVLFSTSRVISPCAIQKQYRKVEKVKKREHVGEHSWATPEERRGQFGDIVKMSRKTPPTISQQQRIPLLTISSLICGDYVFRIMSPHLHFTIASSKFLSLSITIVVNPNRENTCDDNGSEYWHR